MHSRKFACAIALVGAALLFAGSVVVGTPIASAGGSSRALQLINSSRASAGLGPLQGDGTLNSIAQQHAQRMAAEGRVFHNASYPSGAGSWEAYGENVGRGPTVDAVHNAFMNSSSHRSNILSGKYNVVGIGVASYSGGLMIVQNFLKRTGQAPPPRISAPRTSSPQRAPVRRRQAQPAPPPSPPPPPVREPSEPLGCHWVGSPGP